MFGISRNLLSILHSTYIRTYVILHLRSTMVVQPQELEHFVQVIYIGIDLEQNNIMLIIFRCHMQKGPSVVHPQYYIYLLYIIVFVQSQCLNFKFLSLIYVLYNRIATEQYCY